MMRRMHIQTYQPNPNPNLSRIVQSILQIAQSHKLRETTIAVTLAVKIAYSIGASVRRDPGV